VKGDSFLPFYGEFLVSPIPLELSFNFCSHGCRYCFANLNKPNRRADIKATMNLLANYRQRSTLEAVLLREGYPVLISNRVDPFADSNYRQTLPIFELLSELNIPVAIQTKGGKGADKLLDTLKSPTVFYITIETDDDVLAKGIAPGAPNISERFELIDLVRSKGHPVVIGWNPAVKKWIRDEDAHIQRLQKAGVHGVWIQELHFSRTQNRNLKPKDIEILTPELITRSTQKKTEQADIDYVEHLAEKVLTYGIQPFIMFQSRKSSFFDVYHNSYEKTFPVIQDVVNTCHDLFSPGTIFAVEDFLGLAEDMPKGTHQLGHYICSTNYSLCKKIAEEQGSPWNHKMSYKELLALAWKDSRVKFSPGRNLGFQYAITPEKEDWADENGYPFLVWQGKSSLEWDCIVEEENMRI